MKYFSLAMSLLYALAGCGFLFTDMLIAQIPRYRVPLGAILLGYGLVRVVLWWRKYARGNAPS